MFNYPYFFGEFTGLFGSCLGILSCDDRHNVLEHAIFSLEVWEFSASLFMGLFGSFRGVSCDEFILDSIRYDVV